MGPIGSMYVAAAGMQKSLQKVSDAARRIAEKGPEIQPVADMMAAQHGLEANAAVVRTADKMVGLIIDQKA